MVPKAHDLAVPTQTRDGTLLGPRQTACAWTGLPRILADLLFAPTESLRKAFFSRDSILLWSLTTYGENIAKYTRLRKEPAFAHLRWHEVRSARDAQHLLQSIRLAAPSSS